MSRIPVFQPAIGVDTLKAVTDAFHVGWLGMGAATKQFEEEIGRFLSLEGRHVVATGTGTAALHIALLAAGVKAGDEVITPSHNFVADHQAILACGAEPVLCDVTDDDLGLDPAKCEELVGPRTRAIVPLHFAGIPCRSAEIFALARRRNLRVVEDATHAFGTVIDGRPVGSFGDVACFSFDPVKVITSIDGGAVVTPRAEDVQVLHQFRLLGIDRDTAERYRNARAWDYDVVSPGFRYHLTNIMASIGLSQLARAGEFISNRQRHCRLYSERLAGIDGLRTPATDFEGVSPFIYYVRVAAHRRTKLIDHLKAAGIDTGIHFVPAHRFQLLAGCRRGDLAVTERLGEEIVTLPLHSLMAAETVERVAVEVRRFFGASEG